jgi:hypothetical protein
MKNRVTIYQLGQTNYCLIDLPLSRGERKVTSVYSQALSGTA